MSDKSSRGKEWNRIRLRVLDRDGWVCHQCTRPLEGTDATVDHIIPKSKGGTDDPDNLRAMCRTCNGRRQDRTDDAIRLPWYNENWLNALP